jgi:hypothetical protein
VLTLLAIFFDLKPRSFSSVWSGSQKIRRAKNSTPQQKKICNDQTSDKDSDYHVASLAHGELNDRFK